VCNNSRQPFGAECLLTAKTNTTKSAAAAYNVGATGVDDTAATADIQEPVAGLKLQSLQAGSMHVGSRDIEVQLLQPDWGVSEGLVLVLLGYEHVPWADPHGLDGCVSATVHKLTCLAFATHKWQSCCVPSCTGCIGQ